MDRVEKQDGTGWESKKRTKSPFGKYDPQFQIVGGRVYYVWHEDHGPTEPIWVAMEDLDRAGGLRMGGMNKIRFFPGAKISADMGR
jgi:hypothetical protein